MLCTRFGGDDDDDALFFWRSRAVRTPSRDRKRVVESNNSNCTVAVPKVWGVARRTRAWLRAKVRALDESCKKTRDDIDAASRFGEALGSGWCGSEDMDSTWDSPRCGDFGVRNTLSNRKGRWTMQSRLKLLRDRTLTSVARLDLLSYLRFLAHGSPSAKTF